MTVPVKHHPVHLTCDQGTSSPGFPKLRVGLNPVVWAVSLALNLSFVGLMFGLVTHVMYILSEEFFLSRDAPAERSPPSVDQRRLSGSCHIAQFYRQAPSKGLRSRHEKTRFREINSASYSKLEFKYCLASVGVLYAKVKSRV